MSSQLSEHQRPAKGSVPEYEEANAAEQYPGKPWRWLLPKQKVGSLSVLLMCTSAEVALFMLHKSSGDGEAGKALHILRLNSHFVVAEPEAQRGGTGYQRGYIESQC